MCGRFSVPDTELLMKDFHLLAIPQSKARYNVAPSQNVLCITAPQKAHLLEWGFLPSWAKDAKKLTAQINARSETLLEKPFYKSSYLKRRCLIPISGFYEWKLVGAKKTPHYIKMKEQESFALAGIWSEVESLKKQSFAILTTEPNELMNSIHNRMPVIISAQFYDFWLNPESPIADVQNLLQPFDSNKMKAYSVSTFVNSPKNDSPECIAPV